MISERKLVAIHLFINELQPLPDGDVPNLLLLKREERKTGFSPLFSRERVRG